MDFEDVWRSVELAAGQLEKAQVASWDPTDPADCVTFTFYAYENLVVAAAKAIGRPWTKNHMQKAKLAAQLHTDGLLKTDVSELLERLNDLRKDVSYGDPGFDLLEANLEDLVSELESFHEEVAELVATREDEDESANGSD